jgi:Glycosyltransferase family 87
MNKLKIWWSADRHKSLVFALFYVLLSLVKWLQLTLLDKHFSNNFRIFRYSFFHLSNQQRLYIEYPSEHWDYFFYHPVFAFLFAPFAVLPEKMGLFLWLFFLTFVFYKAATLMPFRKGFLWLFFVLIIPELSKNLGHAQPNILNCALMLLVFICLEKEKLALVGLFCALLFCIKGYGVIVGALCFLYPKPWKTILYGILFLLTLSVLPLSITPFQTLSQQYVDWITIIRSDAIIEVYCLMGFAERTLHWLHNEPYIMGFGLSMLGVLSLILMVRRNSLTLKERSIFLSFLLMWVVAFNRAAESSTYLYAIVGALILYHFSQPSRLMSIVIWVCFYVMTVVPSDLAPRFLKELEGQYFFRSLFILPLLFFAFYTIMQRPKSNIALP